MKYFLITCQYKVNGKLRVPLIESVESEFEDDLSLEKAAIEHFEKYEKSEIVDMRITSKIEITKDEYDSY